eukprot:11373375-Alexandrium_andersonii.AAC.1
MSASLVGSEMCIRDSPPGATASPRARNRQKMATPRLRRRAPAGAALRPCLLYTSDAADDM